MPRSNRVIEMSWPGLLVHFQTPTICPSTHAVGLASPPFVIILGAGCLPKNLCLVALYACNFVRAKGGGQRERP